MNEWDGRISVDPEICHGKPCIRGTRIFVSVILDIAAKPRLPAQRAGMIQPSVEFRVGAPILSQAAGKT